MDNKEMVCRINAVLAERNIPKTKFYKDCNITSGAYSQWNQNKTSPSRKTLKRIAEYLDVDEDYLIVGTQAQQKKPSDGIGELSAEEEKFISAYRNAPDQVKALLRDMIDHAVALSERHDQAAESSQ